MISPHIIQSIKAATDLRALAREYGTFRDQGQDLVGACLFHKEDTPSLRVHRTFFKCFGCGASGDAITLLKLIEGISTGSAIRQLAERANIALDNRRVTRQQMASAREQSALCAAWWAEYREWLAEAISGELALETPDAGYLVALSNISVWMLGLDRRARLRVFLSSCTASDTNRIRAERNRLSTAASALIEALSIDRSPMTV